MLAQTSTLLQQAQTGNYAIGGFNVYNLEGMKAVIQTAEASHSPALLQIHPAALNHGGEALVTACMTAATHAAVPIAVHLDHSTTLTDITRSLEVGMTSVMADGSHLNYADNVAFVYDVVQKARSYDAIVEGELGRISGNEDGLVVEHIHARMTDPEQAKAFVEATGVHALAVCIGNIHGKYPFSPQLDFERLRVIRSQVDVPLVLHGASGLPDEQIREAIVLGICKFNVNTEVRNAYLRTLKVEQSANPAIDLVSLMQKAEAAMQQVVMVKLELFGSVNRAT